MQINGTLTGPTMAASEPPEPPPRNPERINASLHKLAESKIIKSFDSSGANVNEKIINNNKPLKALLSLDNSQTITLATNTASTTTTTITTTTTTITSNAHLSPLSKEATTPTAKTLSGKTVVTTATTTPTGNASVSLLNFHNNKTLDLICTVKI